jgi:hypothetical protein
MNHTEVIDEIRPALLQVCEIVRTQQEMLIEMRTALIALLGSLKENNPALPRPTPITSWLRRKPCCTAGTLRCCSPSLIPSEGCKSWSGKFLPALLGSGILPIVGAER